MKIENTNKYEKERNKYFSILILINLCLDYKKMSNVVLQYA